LEKNRHEELVKVDVGEVDGGCQWESWEFFRDGSSEDACTPSVFFELESHGVPDAEESAEVSVSVAVITDGVGGWWERLGSGGFPVGGGRRRGRGSRRGRGRGSHP
jgi:hypothetical protein